MLPIAIGPLSKRLQGSDLIVVIGAPIFRYYPYIPGDYIPPGAELIQTTSDPDDAGSAAVGDSLLGDARLVLESLIGPRAEDSAAHFAAGTARRGQAAVSAQQSIDGQRSVHRAERSAARRCRRRPGDDSNSHELVETWPTTAPDSYYSFASGGLGWGAPAAVGDRLAHKKAGKKRPVVAFIGDGTFQYSIQCLYSAAQNRAKVIFIVACNDEYAVLKDFAILQKTPNCPGLEFPGLESGSPRPRRSIARARWPRRSRRSKTHSRLH